MNIKKIAAAAIAMAMSFGTAPYMDIVDPNSYIFANAADDYTEVEENGIKFKVYEDHAEVSGSASDIEGEVNIPGTVDEKPVTKIGGGSFSGRSKITAVSIPDTVTYIGEGALYSTGIRKIDLPSSLKTIDSYAFYTCWKLSEIDIPEGTETIARDAFSFCNVLSDVKLPSTLKELGENAFYSCENIETVEIPGSVEQIGDSVFKACSGLKTVKLGEGLTEVSDRMFYGLDRLESVELPESLKEIGENAFSGTSIINIDIPSGVTSIGSGAFSNCDNLTSVKLPDGITRIESQLFESCSALAKVELPKGLISIETGAFSECEALTDIEFNDKLTEINALAFGYTGLKDIVIPESVEYIGSSAFNACTDLEKITFMNPDCSIVQAENTIYEEAVIRGYDNSSAQKYAKRFKRTFESIGGGDDPITTTAPSVTTTSATNISTTTLRLTTTTTAKLTTTTTKASTTTTAKPSTTTTKVSTTTTAKPSTTTTKASTTTTAKPSTTTTKASTTTTAKPSTTTTKASTTTTAKPSTTTTKASTTTTAKPSTTTTKASTTTTAKPSTTTTKASTTTTSKPSTTTTTVSSTTTTSVSETTTTSKPALTNEEFIKKADIDGDGYVNAVDASYIIDSILMDKQLPEGKGDVNNDGIFDFMDFKDTLQYYARYSAYGYTDMDKFFESIAKRPDKNDNKVSISQAAAVADTNAKFGEFILEFGTDMPVESFYGQVLFNGKTAREAGFDSVEFSSTTGKNIFYTNNKNGKFASSNNKSNSKLIIRVYGAKAGEYEISYKDLQFYDDNGVKYSGYTKKDFEPRLTITENTATTTTLTDTVTTTSSVTTTSKDDLLNEQLMKNADINCDGEIDMLDVSRINGYVAGLESMLLPDDTSQQPEKGKGDVNGDGKVNVVDCIFLNSYFDKLEKGEDVSLYFAGLTKLPKTIEKKVTISQAAVSCSENDRYCEFELKYSSELPVSAVSGKILINGKQPSSDIGYVETVYKNEGKYIYDIGVETGVIAVRSISDDKFTEDTIIFRLDAPKAGEYTISYDDLKFYGPDCAEYSGYTMKDFEPKITVSEKSVKLGDFNGDGIIDAVDASNILAAYARYSTGAAEPTDEEKAVCDVNRDGLIDAVDSAKVLAYYAHNSGGGTLTFEEFLRK